VETILWRSDITWTLEESSDIPRRIERWETRIAILHGVRFWPLHLSTCISQECFY